MSGFFWFDAHLDQHDYAGGTGGWGSDEQLTGMDRLGGALRVIFCEDAETREYPKTPAEHITASARVVEELLVASTPKAWSMKARHARRNYALHVEGFESFQLQLEASPMVAKFGYWGVQGTNPIYHPGNPLGGCSKEPGVGLTSLGEWFVELLMEHNWWVDLAHMSDRSAHDTIEIFSSLPPKCRIVPPRICYTHGGIRHGEIVEGPTMEHGLAGGNAERSLSIDRALQLVEVGGIVCLSPARPFYTRLEGPFLDHVRALGEASSWKGVGIGTDYGGILDDWRLPGCKTVADCFASVTEFLLGHLEEWQVRKVVGEAARDFFI